MFLEKKITKNELDRIEQLSFFSENRNLEK